MSEEIKALQGKYSTKFLPPCIKYVSSQIPPIHTNFE